MSANLSSPEADRDLMTINKPEMLSDLTPKMKALQNNSKTTSISTTLAKESLLDTETFAIKSKWISKQPSECDD